MNATRLMTYIFWEAELSATSTATEQLIHLTLGKISAHWYVTPVGFPPEVGPLGFDENADINNPQKPGGLTPPDGQIDIYDAALVNYHWLQNAW